MADPVHIRPGIKRRWCPTQVDESGNYIVGQWAYCSDNCPDTNDITKKGRVNSRVKKGLKLFIHLHAQLCEKVPQQYFFSLSLRQIT
jgi:hypothetical protein